MKYFAASNSGMGFYSYYNECFSGLSKLYIIKGGPGTGKSSLMKSVLKASKNEGYKCEEFYCSSDQSSLDGIIVYKKNKSYGMIDGTLPHSYDMRIAGAVDNIVDLGAYWNESMLEDRYTEIIHLSALKKLEYDIVYKYLCSCANLDAVMRMQSEKCIDEEYMKNYINDILPNEHGEGRQNIRLVNSVGMKGYVSFDTFEKYACKAYRFNRLFGGYKILDNIYNELTKRNISMNISYDPITPRLIDGIYDTDNNIAYILSFECEGEKFIDNDYKKIKNELTYAKKLYDSSLNMAIEHFKNIENIHFKLEDIYKNAMNFSGVDKLRDKYVEIFAS